MKHKARDYFAFTSHAAFGSRLLPWIKILRKNNFSIHPFLIPKVLFITSVICLSAPLRWYERLRFSKKISNAKVNAPVFILGHPRSGTTFLHYLMSRDPAFGYCTTMQAMLPHLFLTWSGIFRKMLDKALPATRPMDNVKMGSGLPKEEEFALSAYGIESLVTGYYFPKSFMKNFRKHVIFRNNSSGEERWKKNFDHFLRKLTVAVGIKSLLLKSPANTARVKEILSMYPEAKFIHICRNPYDVYQSHLHLFKKLLPMLSFQEVSDDALEEIVFETYTEIYEKYFRERSLIPKQNLVEIRYEDLVQEPMHYLEQIYKAISLPGFENARTAFEKELKAHATYSCNRFSLDNELSSKIEQRLGFAFEEFGYARNLRPS